MMRRGKQKQKQKKGSQIGEKEKKKTLLQSFGKWVADQRGK